MSIKTVPYFIKGKTVEELTAKMIVNNQKYNKFFQYFDIQKDGKEWVAFYYILQIDAISWHSAAGRFKKEKIAPGNKVTEKKKVDVFKTK